MLNDEREQMRQELEAWINIALNLAQECWQWEMASRQFGKLYYETFADEWRKRRGLLNLKSGERINPSWNDMLEDYKYGEPIVRISTESAFDKNGEMKTFDEDKL